MDLLKNLNNLFRHIIAFFVAVTLSGCICNGVSYCVRQNAASGCGDSVGLEKNVNFSSLSDSTLKLDNLKQLALENNRELQSIYSRWKAARERAPQEAALPDPKVSYDYFIEPIQTKTGPQDQRVGITQTLPWFGKLSLKEKIALKQAEAVYQEYEAARRHVVSEVEKSYYEYSWLHDAIRINREHLALLKVVESVASIRFKTGKIAQVTLVQIQVEQGKLEDRIKELEDLKVPISASICFLIGLENGPVLPAPAKVEEMTDLVNVSELRQQLTKVNPELERLRILKESGDLAIKLAEKNYYPDLTFGLSFIDTEGGDDPALAHVSFNLPIWLESLNAAKREAADRKESTEKLLQDSSNRIYAELELDLYRYSNAERKRALFTDTLIPKAQQSIDLAIKGFEAGSVNFSELLDAERTLLEFKLEAERYLADAYKSMADINALAGKTREGMK